jgi:integrase
VCTHVFKVASTAKDRSLRVLTVNPCAGVVGPDKSDSRRKHWVYPSEFLALMNCDAAPMRWRECYALACYTYLRPGKLAELRSKDVDFDGNRIKVSRAWKELEQEVGVPKTRNGVRAIPIDANLLPLLRRMSVGQEPNDLVTPAFHDFARASHAERLRMYMQQAGIARSELRDLRSRTHMAIGFRSWRDTGATWEALRGTELMKLSRRMGHDNPNITGRYVKEAEDVGSGVGAPFPVLPACLPSSPSESEAECATNDAKKTTIL